MARKKIKVDKAAAKKPKAPQPKKVADLKAPANFPTIGATMSPHAESYFRTRGVATAMSEPRSNWFKRRNWRLIAKRSAIVVAVFLFCSIGWVGFKFYKNFGGITGLWGLFHTTKLKGEDVGRVNILLAGNSADDPGHNGANLTDSIMVLSIDTRDNTAFMLSIPRDLYVSLPAGADPDYTGNGKINQAILDSSFSSPGYPNGGMGDLEQVISQNFGIPIDYYALINYAAFRDAVNAVGGVTVTINSPDGELYDPDTDYATGGILVNLKNGTHTLNGEQALDLARARGDAYGSVGFENSDFQREADQRLMLTALEKKAFSVGVLANPVKLGDLFDSVGKNVKTDLTLSDMHRLYDITKNLNGQPQSLSLSDGGNDPLLTSYTTPTGQDALIPALGLNEFGAIQTYMQQITQVSANPK